MAVKLHFLADNQPKAMQALRACIKRYNQTDMDKADAVIVLGGDGFMLKILQALLNYQIPVFGLNLGHVGSLLNHYTPNNLPDRVASADRISLTPLLVRAKPFCRNPGEAYVFNDASLTRQTPQAARLSTIITDEKDGKPVVMQETVFGDGVLVCTPSGSRGYNMSAGGKVLPSSAKEIGVKSICSRKNFNPILSDKAHIVVTPQEAVKRPVHLDLDGQTRINNIEIALIESDPRKTQTLLLERKQNNR